MKIFISYTMIDFNITLPILNVLNYKLGANHDVFIDIYHNDSKDKQERVMRELDASDVVLLLDTPNIKKSKWVSCELDRAKKRLIPISSFTNMFQPFPLEGSIHKLFSTCQTVHQSLGVRQSTPALCAPICVLGKATVVVDLHLP